MLPLTLDDLMPPDEYAGRRREFYESHQRYLDRYRRVRIGPRVTLVFENRQTLWFRVQELARIAEISKPQVMQQELDLYNRLLPGPNVLQAALLGDLADGQPKAGALEFWQTLQGDQLRLVVADHHCPARLIACRPEDRTLGVVHWVQFEVITELRNQLANLHQSARFRIKHLTYHHESLPLGDDVRQSLLDDLQLSDRD